MARNKGRVEAGEGIVNAKGTSIDADWIEVMRDANKRQHGCGHCA